MAGAGVKASANMWDLLANDDPGDSEPAAAAMARGSRLDGGEAKDKQQQPAPSRGAEPESSGVGGGGGAKHGRKDKKASNRKQQKTKKQPAVANGGEHRNQEEMMKDTAPAPAVGTEGEANDDGSGDYSSDDEDEGAAAGGSCCRGVLRRLFRTAVFMVAVAVVFKSAGTAGRPI